MDARHSAGDPQGYQQKMSEARHKECVLCAFASVKYPSLKSVQRKHTNGHRGLRTRVGMLLTGHKTSSAVRKV